MYQLSLKFCPSDFVEVCVLNKIFDVLGDPREESELLTWLLYQMKEDTIENINRDLMIKMIAQYEFLGVFFCKYMILKHIKLHNNVKGHQHQHKVKFFWE